MGEIIDSIIDNTCTEIEYEGEVVRDHCFHGNTNLTTFTSKDSVLRSIKKYAFEESGLTVANYPNVTTAEEGAFKNCKSLTTANLTGLTSLSDNLLFGCDHLATLNIPNVSSFGESCLSLADTGSFPVSLFRTVHLNESNFASKNVIFKNRCFATSATTPLGDNYITWIDVGDYHFVGQVNEIPEGDTIQVFDNRLYPNNDPRTITAELHNIVFCLADRYPYIYTGSGWDLYVPKFKVDFEGNGQFMSSRVRDIGFKIASTDGQQILYRGSVLFTFIDSSCVSMPRLGTDLGDSALTRVVFLTEQGEFSSVCPYTTLPATAFMATQIYDTDLDFTGVQILNDGCFNSCPNLTELNLPSATTLNGGYGGIFKNSTNLESIVLGNNTSQITFTSNRIFEGCSSLRYLELNSTSMIVLDNFWSSIGNNVTTHFVGTTYLNYKGTTTSTITEGVSASSILIYGAEYTPVNGDYIYDGTTLWLVKNGKWSDTNTTRPRIKVPASLVTTYLTNKPAILDRVIGWGELNPELYFGTLGVVTPSVTETTTPQDIATILPETLGMLLGLSITSFSTTGTATVSILQDGVEIDSITVTHNNQLIASSVLPDASHTITYRFSSTTEFSVSWMAVWGPFGA